MTYAYFDPQNIKETYIAFDQNSGEVMARGQRAIEALQWADLIGPNKSIEVLPAGRAGNYIWTYKIPLAEARLLLAVSNQS